MQSGRLMPRIKAQEVAGLFWLNSRGRTRAEEGLTLPT